MGGNILKEQLALNSYVVEFIPLERRLNDRRDSAKEIMANNQRRKSFGRRAEDILAMQANHLHSIAK